MNRNQKSCAGIQIVPNGKFVAMLTVSHVAALARRAAMSSSYKPALLKALVRIAPTTTDVESRSIDSVQNS